MALPKIKLIALNQSIKEFESNTKSMGTSKHPAGQKEYITPTQERMFGMIKKLRDALEEATGRG